MLFKILNIVSTNHYTCLCKIPCYSGDRKLGFLKRKKLKAVCVNSNFAARRSLPARRCACFLICLFVLNFVSLCFLSSSVCMSVCVFVYLFLVVNFFIYLLICCLLMCCLFVGLCVCRCVVCLCIC